MKGMQQFRMQLPIRTNVGHRIYYIRKYSRNITLPELAERAGLSKGLLSKLENNSLANPSLHTLLKVAKALKCDLAQIVGGVP